MIQWTVFTDWDWKWSQTQALISTWWQNRDSFKFMSTNIILQFVNIVVNPRPSLLLRKSYTCYTQSCYWLTQLSATFPSSSFFIALLTFPAFCCPSFWDMLIPSKSKSKCLWYTDHSKCPVEPLTLQTGPDLTNQFTVLFEHDACVKLSRSFQSNKDLFLVHKSCCCRKKANLKDTKLLYNGNIISLDSFYFKEASKWPE